MSAWRILHVDDEPDIREVVELSLALDPEFSVRGCSSGGDALIAAADWSPDLILLDVMMPSMDGPTTLAHLRERPQTARIPVVFMTARAQPRELDHFVSLGAEGVIAKPFDPMTLAKAVRDYVGRPEIDFAGRRDCFLKRARGFGLELAEQHLALQQAPNSVAALDRIASIAHTIAGGAGVFGLAEMSGDAAALETAAIDRREGRGADVERLLDVLIARIETV